MYKIYAYIAAFVIWTALSYFFGHSIGYDERDLIALNDAKKDAESYKKAIEQRDSKYDDLQNEVSKYAQESWDKYTQAQKDFDAAIDSNDAAWRVRLKSKTCGVQVASSGGVGDGAGAEYGELPIETQRSLERIGEQATKELKQCRAKVEYLQEYLSKVVK